MRIESAGQFMVQMLGAMGLLILLLAGVFARSANKMLGWGAVAAALLAFQFLYFREHYPYLLHDGRKPNGWYWYQVGSLALAAVYFLIGTIRVIRWQLPPSRRKPQLQRLPEADKEAPANTREVPVWLPFFFMFAMAVVLSSFFGVGGIVFLPALSLGLPALSPNLSSIHDKQLARTVATMLIAFAYVLYLALFVALFHARNWNRFGIVCFDFLLVLLLNIAGCSRLLEGYASLN